MHSISVTGAEIPLSAYTKKVAGEELLKAAAEQGRHLVGWNLVAVKLQLDLQKAHQRDLTEGTTPLVKRLLEDCADRLGNLMRNSPNFTTIHSILEALQDAEENVREAEVYKIGIKEIEAAKSELRQIVGRLAFEYGKAEERVKELKEAHKYLTKSS